MNSSIKKPLIAAIGAAFMASVALPVLADSNPFTAKPLSSGYDLVNKASAEGKCGEGGCGAMKKSSEEGKCGDMEKCKTEGKCGDAKKCSTEANGEKCMSEGKCGDAKKCKSEEKKLEQKSAVNADKAMSEGKCGDM